MSDFFQNLLGRRPGQARVQAVTAGPEVAERMQELHDGLLKQMSETVISGESGGGMVRIQMALDGTPKGVTISPELYDRGMLEPLEDLILAALQDAKRHAEREAGKIRADHMERVERVMKPLFKKDSAD